MGETRLFGAAKRNDAECMSPLVLAFTGDAVYNLYVRTRLTTERDLTPNALHRLCSKTVCAKTQAIAADKLQQELTADEADIYRRGKNAKPGSVPKNADPGDYAKATGLEAVIGCLFLHGEEARAAELLHKAYEFSMEGLR